MLLGVAGDRVAGEDLRGLLDGLDLAGAHDLVVLELLDILYIYIYIHIHVHMYMHVYT